MVQRHLGHDHQCGEIGVPGRPLPWLQVGGDRAMPNVKLSLLLFTSTKYLAGDMKPFPSYLPFYPRSQAGGS